MGILKDYFLNSTIHGFHFIADQRYHWSERLFWSICVLGSWFGSISLMTTALQQYRNQKISFSVDTSYLDWKTNFPAIFVCERKNPKTTVKLKNKYGHLMNSTCFDRYIENFAFYDGLMDYKIIPAGCNITGKYSEIMKESRNSCFDIMKSCMYNNEEFNCCEEFLIASSSYGPCFGFNTITTNKYNSRESLPFKITRNIKYGYGNLTFELKHQGFHILAAAHNSIIGRRSLVLYQEANKDVKNVPKNLYTYYVSVKEIFTTIESKILDVDHRGCRFQEENILKRAQFYSMAACETECFSNFQNLTCGCIAHTLPGTALEEECEASGLICIESPEFAKNVKYSKKCGCVSSCDDTEINLIGTNAQLNIEENVLQDKTSQLGINVIVQPPTIRYTRQVVKTPLSLLVSVGGTVSLFIGASLLTIVEIVYYFLIRPIGNYYLNNNNKKNAGNNEEHLNNELHNIRKRGKESRNISTVSKAKNVKSAQYYSRYLK